MRNNIIIFVLLIFSSCVSLKPAKTFNKAENKIIQFNKGIQNQIERYPNLIDRAYTYTEIDTVFIKEESAEFKASLVKVDSLLSVIDEYGKWLEGRDEYIDSLMNIPLNEFPEECQAIANELTRRNNTLLKELQLRNKELTKVFDIYQVELNKRINGVYTDSIFHVGYEYYKGVITIKPTVKSRWQLYEKSITTNNIDIRKHFWQDFKFWIFLSSLLVMFYSFNSFVYNILDSIFTAIKKFVKNLFTKI